MTDVSLHGKIVVDIEHVFNIFSRILQKLSYPLLKSRDVICDTNEAEIVGGRALLEKDI